MDGPYIVIGVNRFGEVAELRLLTVSVPEAQRLAELAGLRSVAVTAPNTSAAPGG